MRMLLPELILSAAVAVAVLVACEDDTGRAVPSPTPLSPPAGSTATAVATTPTVVPTATPDTAPPFPGVTEVAARNAQYRSGLTREGTVTLVDGEFRAPAAPGSASEVVVRFAFAEYAELTGDERTDAAVVLVSSGGGSGTFYSLEVLAAGGESAEHLDGALLGDRITVQQVTVEDRRIVVELLDRPRWAPFAEPPSVEVRRTFEQRGDRLVELYVREPGGFTFALPDEWAQRVDSEELDADEATLPGALGAVRFVVDPGPGGELRAEPLLVISWLASADWAELERQPGPPQGLVLLETAERVYVGQFPQSNPYGSHTPAGETFERLFVLLGDAAGRLAIDGVAAAARGSVARCDLTLPEAPLVFVDAPRSGQVVSSGFAVTGCSRTFEATVNWRLLDRTGAALAEGFTMGGGVDGPGPFRFTVEFAPVEPQIGHLEVFEVDASGGEGFPPPRDVVPLVLR